MDGYLFPDDCVGFPRHPYQSATKQYLHFPRSHPLGRATPVYALKQLSCRQDLGIYLPT